MKLLKTIVTLTVLILTSSCTKDNYVTTVYGHVYTKGTTNYPGNGSTELGVQVNNGSNAFDYVGKFMTDANGYYSYTFNANQYKFYHVVATQSFANHWHPYSYSGKGIQISANQQIDLIIAPHAYLQLHVRNQINPQIGDNLYLNWGDNTHLDVYADFDETIIKKFWGNSNYIFAGAFYRNGLKYDINDTIYLPAFDTTYFLIDIDY